MKYLKLVGTYLVPNEDGDLERRVIAPLFIVFTVFYMAVLLGGTVPPFVHIAEAIFALAFLSYFPPRWVRKWAPALVGVAASIYMGEMKGSWAIFFICLGVFWGGVFYGANLGRIEQWWDKLDSAAKKARK